jgi:hypothetical protein
MWLVTMIVNMHSLVSIGVVVATVLLPVNVSIILFLVSYFIDTLQFEDGRLQNTTQKGKEPLFQIAENCRKNEIDHSRCYFFRDSGKNRNPYSNIYCPLLFRSLLSCLKYYKDCK